MAEGRIVKALSGFYYVRSGNDLYACRGRGVFRKREINPLVGDFVTFDVTNEKEGYITEIKKRNNKFSRPPVANIDQAVVVSSAAMPDFSTLLLDRFLLLFESKNIPSIIFITKVDLLADNERKIIETYKKEYEQIGYTVELAVAKEGSDLSKVAHYFEDKVSAIVGQSGVGKSSILNAMNPDLFIKTAEISTSLGRGKHTTRHVELVAVNNGLIADTPGFSTVDFNEIEPENLAVCFPEMKLRRHDCKFRGCLHNKEPNCAIKNAVDQGEIVKYRYEHYLSFLSEIQTREPRY